MVLLLAAPVMGALSISCTQENPNWCVVSYSGAPADPNRPRAFALSISLSDGAVIGNAPAADPDADFYVYPGSIVISGGVVSDWGSPVASGGNGSSTMVIEMGSLYAASDTKYPNPPPASGELFRFTVDMPTTVTITEDAIRGKVIKENGGPSGLPDPVCSCSIGLLCCCGSCPGDLDMDGWVTPDDLTLLVIMLQGFSDAEYMCEGGTSGCDLCADLDGDDWVTPDDLTLMVVYLQAHSDSEFMIECPLNGW